MNSKYLLIFLFILISSICFGQETISVATGEFPPTVGSKLKHYGFASHMLSLAFKTQGIKTKFIFLPWIRAYKITKTGKYHATSSWFCTKRRQKDFYCGKRVVKTDFYFFYLAATNFHWETLNDLKKYKIGLTLGYTYNDEFIKMVKDKKLNIQEVENDKQNFSKLFMGRMDIFPMELIGGYYILRKNFAPEQLYKIKHHPKPLHNSTAHPLFPKTRKDSKKLLKTFNKGMDIITKKGIFEKYELKLIQGWYD